MDCCMGKWFTTRIEPSREIGPLIFWRIRFFLFLSRNRSRLYIKPSSIFVKHNGGPVAPRTGEKSPYFSFFNISAWPFVSSFKITYHLWQSCLGGKLKKPNTIRRSLWNNWHPSSRTKTKDLFINLRSNCFMVFPVRVESFLRPFEPRPEERKKVNFRKEPQRHPYTMINFPSSQECHCLRAFSQFWEQRRKSKGWMIKLK